VHQNKMKVLLDLSRYAVIPQHHESLNVTLSSTFPCTGPFAIFVLFALNLTIYRCTISDLLNRVILPCPDSTLQ